MKISRKTGQGQKKVDDKADEDQEVNGHCHMRARKQPDIFGIFFAPRGPTLNIHALYPHPNKRKKFLILELLGRQAASYPKVDRRVYGDIG